MGETPSGQLGLVMKLTAEEAEAVTRMRAAAAAAKESVAQIQAVNKEAAATRATIAADDTARAVDESARDVAWLRTKKANAQEGAAAVLTGKQIEISARLQAEAATLRELQAQRILQQAVGGTVSISLAEQAALKTLASDLKSVAASGEMSALSLKQYTAALQQSQAETVTLSATVREIFPTLLGLRTLVRGLTAIFAVGFLIKEWSNFRDWIQRAALAMGGFSEAAQKAYETEVKFNQELIKRSPERLREEIKITVDQINEFQRQVNAAKEGVEKFSYGIAVGSPKAAEFQVQLDKATAALDAAKVRLQEYNRELSQKNLLEGDTDARSKAAAAVDAYTKQLRAQTEDLQVQDNTKRRALLTLDREKEVIEKHREALIKSGIAAAEVAKLVDAMLRAAQERYNAELSRSKEKIDTVGNSVAALVERYKDLTSSAKGHTEMLREEVLPAEMRAVLARKHAVDAALEGFRREVNGRKLTYQQLIALSAAYAAFVLAKDKELAEELARIHEQEAVRLLKERERQQEHENRRQEELVRDLNRMNIRTKEIAAHAEDDARARIAAEANVALAQAAMQRDSLLALARNDEERLRIISAYLAQFQAIVARAREQAYAVEHKAAEQMIKSAETTARHWAMAYDMMNAPLGRHIAVMHRAVMAAHEQYQATMQQVRAMKEQAAATEDATDKYALQTAAVRLSTAAKKAERQAIEDAAMAALAGAAQVIGGKRAAAAVEGAYDAVKAIEEWAAFAASGFTAGWHAAAGAQYTVAAVEMFKIAGTGGGGTRSGGGSRGGGFGGGVREGGRGGEGYELPGLGGPRSVEAGTTVNLHIYGGVVGAHDLSSFVSQITEGAQRGNLTMVPVSSPVPRS